MATPKIPTRSKTMSKITIAFTYAEADEESVANGDLRDHGFYAPEGWKYSLNDQAVVDDAEANPHLYKVPWEPVDLSMAIIEAQRLGICEASDSEISEGTWWSSVDDDIDYQTGISTQYSLHIDGCTVATKRRIHRLLNG
jgi:hypothetical protein